MSSIDQAVQTQLTNIQKKTGKSLAELSQIVRQSGLSRHGEIRDLLRRELDLGYGDASMLVHALQGSDGARLAEGKSKDEVLDGIYTGAKAALRPIYEALMAEIIKFGEFEVAPKKGYVSLRRKRQFAMIGPATNTRLEVGLNAKDLPVDARLLVQPKGSMCNYIVRVTSLGEVDDQLFSWIRTAFDAAG